jgi:hypothetical protein
MMHAGLMPLAHSRQELSQHSSHSLHEAAVRRLASAKQVVIDSLDDSRTVLQQLAAAKSII